MVVSTFAPSGFRSISSVIIWLKFIPNTPTATGSIFSSCVITTTWRKSESWFLHIFFQVTKKWSLMQLMTPEIFVEQHITISGILISKNYLLIHSTRWFTILKKAFGCAVNINDSKAAVKLEYPHRSGNGDLFINSWYNWLFPMKKKIPLFLLTNLPWTLFCVLDLSIKMVVQTKMTMVRAGVSHLGCLRLLGINLEMVWTSLKKAFCIWGNKI